MQTGLRLLHDDGRGGLRQAENQGHEQLLNAGTQIFEVVPVRWHELVLKDDGALVATDRNHKLTDAGHDLLDQRGDLVPGGWFVREQPQEHRRQVGAITFQDRRGVSNRPCPALGLPKRLEVKVALAPGLYDV